MTTEEQQRYDQVQQQLSDANRKIEQIRAHLSYALGRSRNEAGLYRGLFWFLFLVVMAVTILHFFLE